SADHDAELKTPHDEGAVAFLHAGETALVISDETPGHDTPFADTATAGEPEAGAANEEDLEASSASERHSSRARPLEAVFAPILYEEFTAAIERAREAEDEIPTEADAHLDDEEESEGHADGGVVEAEAHEAAENDDAEHGAIAHDEEHAAFSSDDE